MAAIRPLNAELRKIAEEELNEVESRIPEDIAAIKKWLESQPHLKSRTTDQFLVTFLRGCKYSLEKCKSKLDYFYTIRTLLPEIFRQDNIDQLLELGRSGVFASLFEPLGPGGPRLQITKYSKINTKIYRLVDLFSYYLLFADMEIVSDDNFVIAGQVDIVDFGEMSLSFLAQFDLTLIKKLAVYTEKAAPVRIKGLHILNCPKEAVTILNIIRSFLSEKLQKRVYIHKNFDEFHKIIPKEYLPVEYGGTNGNIPDIIAKREQEMLSYATYFAEESQYGVVEKLRPGAKLNKEALFGMQGSFRKLDID